MTRTQAKCYQRHRAYQTKLLNQRREKILRDRKSGATLRKIADRYFVSPERVRQIVKAEGRRLKRLTAGNEIEGERNGVILSTRTLNCLHNYFDTREISVVQVRDALPSLRVGARTSRGGRVPIGYISNFGRKSLEELERWLGPELSGNG